MYIITYISWYIALPYMLNISSNRSIRSLYWCCRSMSWDPCAPAWIQPSVVSNSRPVKPSFSNLDFTCQGWCAAESRNDRRNDQQKRNGKRSWIAKVCKNEKCTEFIYKTSPPAEAIPLLSAECLGQVLLMAISAVRTDASQGFPLTVREALESHFALETLCWMLSLDAKVNTLNICRFPRGIFLLAPFANQRISKISKARSTARISDSGRSSAQKAWSSSWWGKDAILERLVTGKTERSCLALLGLTVVFYGFPVLLHISPWFQTSKCSLRRQLWKHKNRGIRNKIHKSVKQNVLAS